MKCLWLLVGADVLLKNLTHIILGDFKDNNLKIFFFKFYKNTRPYGRLSKKGLELH